MHFSTSSSSDDFTGNGSGNGGVAPLGTGGEGDFGDMTGGEDLAALTLGEPKKKRALNSGGFVLLAVVVAAAGGLYSMRTLTKATAANSETSPVEQSINEFIDGLMGEKGAKARASANADDTVLDVLTGTYTQRQVALSHVQRNPFVIFEEAEATVAAPEPVATDPKVQLRKDRQVFFEQAAGRIRVRTIMMGSTPMANIDNRIVRVGDTIVVEPENVTFRIEAIAADHVIVAAHDSTLDVTVRKTVNFRRNS